MRPDRCRIAKEHGVFNKIIVPLDAAQEAEYVLPLAAALAKTLGDQLVLLSVIPDAGDLNPVANEYDAVLDDLQEHRRSYAESYLRRIQIRVSTDTAQTTIAVRTGPIAETIIESADAEGAGLIAMATHGRVGPERWFLGSVADRVVHTSPIPVLLVRPGETSVPAASLPTNILVPLDGSARAEGALPTAIGIAAECHAPITLIRTIPNGWWNMGGEVYGGGVSSTPDLLSALEDDAKAYVATTAASLRARGIEVRVSTALFRAADLQIAEVAESCEAPLVVMTGHGRTGVRRTLLGSVADRVVRSSAAPVLVVPSPVTE